MDMTTAQIAQLAVALLMAVLIFVVAWIAPLKTAVTILFVLVPFQLIETKYGSSSEVMTFILVAGLMLSGRQLRVPLLGPMLIVLFCYLISLTQVDKSLVGQHMVFVKALISGLLVLILTYNLAREVKEARSLVNALIVMDVLVCIYCGIQLGVGLQHERTIFFGIQELSLIANRADDARLVGPFAAAGITAEFFAILTVVLCYDLIYSVGRRKLLLIAVIAANLAFMVATANRGAFLTLIATFPLFLFAFRRVLGTMRVLQFSIAGALLLAGMAVIIVSYTDFDRMFERLEDTTETINGVPATRVNTWPVVWENVKVQPWLGSGPRLRLLDDDITPYKGHVYMPYPHSLYLYLLATVGIFGLMAMVFFIFRVGWHLHAARNRIFESEYVMGFSKLGVLLIFAFMIDQIRIEFLRIELVDYQHFIFGMFGMWLGLADRGKQPLLPVASPAVGARARASFG